MRQPLVIYLHGFGSSPASYKAQVLKRTMAETGQSELLEIPQLSFDPRQAMASLQQQVETLQDKRDITLIGSSLGGYYASSLTETYGLKSVLINPVVKTQGLFEKYLGCKSC